MTEEEVPTPEEPEGRVDSSSWRFDPADPPNEWTKELVGRLTMGQIENLSDPENDILSEEQQASFDTALAESNRELNAKIRPAIQAMLPKFKMPEIAPGLSDSFKRIQDLAAKQVSFPTVQTPALDHLRELQADQVRWQEEMDALADEVAEANRQREERADAQAKATLEIADAQRRLQEMQVEALDLARQQAAASTEIALAQQAVLAAITEELGVLQEQNRGQRELIRSGWAGGVVMEWTLFVAVIAAVATIVLGTVGPDGIQWYVWVGAAVVTVALSAALGIWQWRRQPVSEVE